MENKNKGGRPRKEIDFKLFEELCKIHCTQSEICSVLGVTDKTLNKRLIEQYEMGFSDIYIKYAETGKMSLRRIQFKHAQTSVPMAIWLGKVILKQREPSIFDDNDTNLEAVDFDFKTVSKKD